MRVMKIKRLQPGDSVVGKGSGMQWLLCGGFQRRAEAGDIMKPFSLFANTEPLKDLIYRN